MYVPSPEAFHLHLFIRFFTKTDQWLLVMSTQLIGYSICGISNLILVAPSSMIWPNTLGFAAILNTLHSHETTGTHASGGISRARFFTYFFVGYFLYSQFLFISPPWRSALSDNSYPRRLLAILPLHSTILFSMGLLDRP
jgi:OPT oligopeptide transporter protein